MNELASKFEEIIESLQFLTGLHICVHDLSGFTQEEFFKLKDTFCIHYSEFCQVVKNSKRAFKECIKCDTNADNQMLTSKKPFIHRCHAGLTEIIVPVIKDGEILGNIFCGQAVLDKDRKFFPKIKRRLKKLGVNIKKLEEAYTKLPVVSKDILLHAGKILFILVSWVVENHRLITIQKTIQHQQYKPIMEAISYIKHNTKKEITLDKISFLVGLSPTYFSKVFYKATGKSFQQFVIQCKVEEAKKMILNTDLKIIDIAYELGYKDQSYFAKVFKKYSGYTPYEFKKLKKKKE